MRIWIYGAGDLGREILSTIKEQNKVKPNFHVAGFIDDTEGYQGKVVEGVDVKHWSSLTDEEVANSTFIIAVGNGVLRKKIHEEIELSGAKLASPIIHPRAYIADDVELGKGVYIGPNTVVAIKTKVGQNVVINQNCSIGHDCQLEENVVISPGCVLSGRVHIGNATFLGSAAVVLPKICVQELCVVGANVTLAQNVDSKQKVLAVTRNMSLPIEGNEV